MPAYTTQDIRNIALVGQAGSGKTSLVEALLHAAGVIGTLGKVEAGDTACDFTDEEKKHGHSLCNAIVHIDHAGKHINLIDTPGSPDFIGQALTALPAVETVAVVINAANGIEPMARRMMQRARERKLCRMIIVNKIDSDTADLEALVAQLQQTFGSECIPIDLPARDREHVVNVFEKAEGESALGPVDEAHTAVIDQVVEVDEDLMETYLEQGDVEPEQLHDPFEKALREGHLVPICFVAARPHHHPDRPIGVKELLDILVKLAPSPLEGNPRPFIRGSDTDNELHATPDPDAHVLAHVFNVRMDPFVGKLAAFRVHQGTVTGQTHLFVDDVERGVSRKPFKVGHLFRLQGKQHVEVDAAIPGDIAAIVKVEEVRRDAVLHDSHEEDHLHLKPIDLPEPMQGLAVSPKKRGDEQKIADALHKLQEEDPSFRVTRDNSTHETVIHGMGELHLRVILEKLSERYHVEVDTRPPKIAYRETVQKKAEGHHRHKKQTGGAGQFGEVFLRVEPLPRGSGFEFVNDTFGGSIPVQFIPAVEKGVRQALEEGALAGYPVQDIKVSVYDGKHHPVDSKEVAFVAAGRRAFVDAFQKANPALLEPMVTVEVTVPQRYMGDITGDLSGKRGRILGSDIVGDQAVVKAVVPLAEVTNYQNQLKSVTGGQGSFVMELSHYDPVPSHVAQRVIAEYKPRDNGDA
jgi:elongation factor G